MQNTTVKSKVETTHNAVHGPKTHLHPCDSLSLRWIRTHYLQIQDQSNIWVTKTDQPQVSPGTYLSSKPNGKDEQLSELVTNSQN